MRKSKRRWIMAGAVLLLLLGVVPGFLWISLTHQPDFYRALSRLSAERRKEGARKFVAQSLQLRNDIINENHWEALFSDQEVNAWLAEDLVVHFADQLPPGVSEPRVVFEPDRAILAFRLEDGPIRSVIWVVARVRVTEPNVLALTIEKIRAGVMPVPADQVLERIAQHARSRGLDVEWDKESELPVALIRYTPHLSRRDIVLEHFQIFEGHVRLTGRSENRAANAHLTLPSAALLQATFPRSRKVHRSGDSGSRPVSFLRSSTTPAS